MRDLRSLKYSSQENVGEINVDTSLNNPPKFFARAKFWQLSMLVWQTI